jgi:hypothetical protein
LLAKFCIPIVLGLATFCLALPLPAETPATSLDIDPLYIAVTDGHYGFVNANGSFVIPPTYEDVRDFRDGMAAVKQNGVWGYITRSGKLAIKPRFPQSGDFVNGRAAVVVADIARRGHFERKWNFINKNGEYLSERTYGINGCESTELPKVGSDLSDCSVSYLDPQTFRHPRYFVEYKQALPCFEEGFAIVTQNGKQGYLHSGNGASISARFEHAGPFYDGIATVREDGKFGFIDTSGNYIVPPRFNYATPVIDGVAVFSEDFGSENPRFGIVGKDGTILHPADLPLMSPLSHDRFAMWSRSEHVFRLIDVTGRPITSLGFSSINTYRGPLASAVTAAGRHVYINKAGDIVQFRTPDQPNYERELR